ncbi:hypothetical protein BCR34DRAFT_639862 [Clohesyomyces aquaticus]|uniref:Uncharacterized protein n=1 Tax=Clohesyomyces aquaticus TaxID=1231657 RepID=A0A1Y2A294_9PLEO|nr:hypothetical protein BCR34DRAFT_639862 [Clohesyomyces aquaticus]
MLLSDIAKGVIAALKGSSALARTAARLKQALANTKAAKHAQAERRRRSRRAVEGSRGPIYAADCPVTARVQRLLTKRINAWKRLRPSIQSNGKRATKRHANRVTVVQDVQRWVYSINNLERASQLQALHTKSVQYLEKRGKFQARHTITASSLNAAKLSLVARNALDPYNLLLQQKGRIESKEPIVKVPDSQAIIQETQVTSELLETPTGAQNGSNVTSDYRDKGYSSPLDYMDFN